MNSNKHDEMYVSAEDKEPTQVASMNTQLDHPPQSEFFCRFCRNPINPNAKVCHFCSRDQSLWRNAMGFSANIATVVGVAVAFAAALLALLQFREANQERVEASLALERATNAVAKAESTSKLAESRAEELRKMQSIMLTKQETIQIGIIRRDAPATVTDSNAWNFLFMSPQFRLLQNHRSTRGGQYNQYLTILSGLRKHRELLAKISQMNIDQVSMDFTEMLVFMWLCDNYSLSWQRKPGVGTTSSPFFRPQGFYDYQLTTPHTRISKVQLLQALSMNFFTPVTQDDFYLRGFKIPVGTTLSTEREDVSFQKRTILFSHEAFSLKISLHSMGSSAIKNSIYANPNLDELLDLKGEWFFQQIVALIQVEFEPTFALTEDAAHIYHWINDMMAQLRHDFDWYAVAEDLLSIGPLSDQTEQKRSRAKSP